MDSSLPVNLISSSFAMFPGIGPAREQQLWEMGIVDWSQLLNFSPNPDHKWFRSVWPDMQVFKNTVEEWIKNLEERNFTYFAHRLPNRDLWRLIHLFPDKFCYLDIETTGIDSRSVMTVASLYVGNEMLTFQRGKNLEFMLDYIKEDYILVSYNGRRFDVPFIEKEFGQKIPNLHLDLMNVLHEMGIKGGLKKSEEILGLARPLEVSKVDGRLAPILWHNYQQYDQKSSLDLLIAYNQEDTKNLEWILREIYHRKLLSFLEYTKTSGLFP